MFVQLGAALSVKVQYLQLRGNTYQFRIRIPQHLVSHYGKPDIRKSLGTSDIKEACKRAEEEARRYLAEFQLLSQGKQITPAFAVTAPDRAWTSDITYVRTPAGVALSGCRHGLVFTKDCGLGDGTEHAN